MKKWNEHIFQFKHEQNACSIKALSKSKRVHEIKVLLKVVATLAYHSAIYQSTQNGSQLYAFKTPETDKKE